MNVAMESLEWRPRGKEGWDCAMQPTKQYCKVLVLSQDKGEATSKGCHPQAGRWQTECGAMGSRERGAQ